MPKIRILIVALVVVTIGVLAFIALVPAPPPPESRPAEATRLVLRGYSEGIVTWEAEAERGEVNSASSALSDVVLRVFEGASTAVEVTASALTRDAEAITLTGGVSGQTKDGLTLETDEMTWKETERRLDSGPTQLRWGTDEWTADALRFNTDLHEATLTGVRGTVARDSIYAVAGERAEISRDRIVLAGVVTIASGEASVQADELETGPDREDVTLRGNVHAQAPKLELAADSLRLAPEGLTAAGHVVVDVEFASREERDGA